MKITWLAVCVLLAVGCATPYQPLGVRGGFDETQLQPDVFRVTFKGNGFTSPERAADLSLLRCAELALKLGYPYFAVVDSQFISKESSHTAPTQSNTTSSATANRLGNSVNVYGSSQTTTFGGQTYTVRKPSASNTVLLLKNKTGFSGLIYDAQFLVRSLGGAHGVPAVATYQPPSNAPPNDALPSSPPAKAVTVEAQAPIALTARTGPGSTPTSPVRMASANNSTITVLLGPGWKKTATTIDNKPSFRIHATNASVDAGLLILANSTADVENLGSFSEAHRARMVAALSNATASELTKLKIQGLDALQGEVAGSDKSGLKVRYLNTYVQGEKEVATISIWTTESAFSANRAEFESVLSGLRF